MSEYNSYVDRALSIILVDVNRNLVECCAILNGAADLYHRRYCTEVQMSSDMVLHQNLMCSNCWSLINDVVSPICGHLVCRSCFRLDGKTHCLICLYIYSLFDENIRPNILINSIISAIINTSKDSFRRKDIANHKLRKRFYFEAISEYTALLNEGFCRHLILSNRSYAYLMIDKLSLALEDTEELLNCAWSWYKSHYRHAMVLKKQNNIYGLIESLLNALIFKPDDNLLLSELKGALEILLTPDYRSQIKERFPVLQVKRKNMEEWLVDVIRSSNQIYLNRRTSENCHHEISNVVYYRSKSFDSTSIGNSSISKRKSWRMGVDPRLEETKNILDVTDFDCPICLRICMNPIAIICGHTFCEHCIQRTVDHIPTCPLCKTDIQIYLKMKQIPVCHQLQNIFHLLWPIEVRKHTIHYEKELFILTRNPNHTSFMICTVASPGMPCELHLFEPRYLLMLRRAIESKIMRFGMVLNDSILANGHCEIGVMLTITKVEPLHGRRYVVSTCAAIDRLRIIESSFVDGYVMAKTESYIDSILDENRIKVFDQLASVVHSSAKRWIQMQSFLTKGRIIEHFGEIPQYQSYLNHKGSLEEVSKSLKRSSYSKFTGQDLNERKRKINCAECVIEPAPWIWWLVAVLPIDEKIKYTLLASNDPLYRMEQMNYVINSLVSQNKLSS